MWKLWIRYQYRLSLNIFRFHSLSSFTNWGARVVLSHLVVSIIISVASKTLYSTLALDVFNFLRHTPPSLYFSHLQLPMEYWVCTFTISATLVSLSTNPTTIGSKLVYAIENSFDSNAYLTPTSKVHLKHVGTVSTHLDDF